MDYNNETYQVIFKSGKEEFYNYKNDLIYEFCKSILNNKNYIYSDKWILRIEDISSIILQDEVND